MSLRLSNDEYKALCRRVWDRDGWRCRNPRCQLRNNLSCHHIKYRSENGPDESWNICALCVDCHSAVHNYKLFISVAESNHVGPGGGADGKLVFTYE
jgi:5-methylcytosine-specific restriction endonuclease McrA